MKILSKISSFVLILSMAFISFGQKSESQLQKEYLNYLKADSNKVVVGFRFITDEGGNELGKWFSCFEIFDREYTYLLLDKEHITYAPSGYAFEEEYIWEWNRQEQESIYMRYTYPYNHKPYTNNLAYIRCEKIKMELEPTFLGYIKWKEKTYGL